MLTAGRTVMYHEIHKLRSWFSVRLVLVAVVFLIPASTGYGVDTPLLHDAPVIAAVFSPDGKTIVTVSHKTARLWDAKTGALRGKPISTRAR